MVRVSTLWSSVVAEKYSFVVTQGLFPQQTFSLSLARPMSEHRGHRHTNQVAQGLVVQQKDDHHGSHDQSPRHQHQRTSWQGVRCLYYVEADLSSSSASAQGSGYLQIPGKANRDKSIQLPRTTFPCSCLYTSISSAVGNLSLGGLCSVTLELRTGYDRDEIQIKHCCHGELSDKENVYVSISAHSRPAAANAHTAYSHCLARTPSVFSTSPHTLATAVAAD